MATPADKELLGSSLDSTGDIVVNATLFISEVVTLSESTAVLLLLPKGFSCQSGRAV